MFPAYRAEYSNVMWGDSTSSPAGGLELGHLAADPMGWLIVGRQAPGPQPAPGTPTCPWHLELDSLAHSESPWARGAPTLCWPVLLQTPHSAGLGNAACDFEGARGLCTQRWGSREGGALNWVLIKASGESLAGWRMSVGRGKPASLFFTTFSRNSAPPSAVRARSRGSAELTDSSASRSSCHCLETSATLVPSVESRAGRPRLLLREEHVPRYLLFVCFQNHVSV